MINDAEQKGLITPGKVICKSIGTFWLHSHISLLSYTDMSRIVEIFYTHH
jgi:hypothetical protein